MLRSKGQKFQHINKQEEPPLRALDHGLYGESVEIAPEEPDPYPYMIRSEDGNRCFHGYRFDQDVCEEAAHTSNILRNIFGAGMDNAGAYFRYVLGYAAGSKDFIMSDEKLGEQMKEALFVSALKVFGEEKNEEALKHSRMFSMYANLVLPGQRVNLHLDVPEFHGLDRSKCPSWLLVAAQCSGLFSSYAVKNVTAVCYPLSAYGGELGVYCDGEKEGELFVDDTNNDIGFH